MAHPKREQFIPGLLKSLDRPVPVIWDRRNDRWDTGSRALLAFDPEATHHLVLQDDALPCRDLLAGTEKALGSIPTDAVVSLYTGRTSRFRRQLAMAGNRSRWLVMKGLHWGVGVVVPTRFIPDLVEWGNARPHIANYDKRISRWCEQAEAPVYYTWPSLVQHRISPSMVAGRGQGPGRTAYWFVGHRRSALDVDWNGPQRPVTPGPRRARRRPVRAARR